MEKTLKLITVFVFSETYGYDYEKHEALLSPQWLQVSPKDYSRQISFEHKLERKSPDQSKFLGDYKVFFLEEKEALQEQRRRVIKSIKTKRESIRKLEEEIQTLEKEYGEN